MDATRNHRYIRPRRSRRSPRASGTCAPRRKPRVRATGLSGGV